MYVLKSIPVVQLDYNTGEFIREFRSMVHCAAELEIPLANITVPLGKSCVAKITKYNTLIITKEAYKNLLYFLV